MIGTLLAHLTPAAILAANNDGGPLWLLALGPAGAAGLYFGLWSFYRNTGKSHSFERETRVVAKPITGHENKVDEITGTRSARIDGDNGGDHRKRVQRVT